MAICPFNEIVDLPSCESTVAKCPVCEAHRTLQLAFQEGVVYAFPSHKFVARRKEQPAWRRVGRVWQWHDLKTDVGSQED